MHTLSMSGGAVITKHQGLNTIKDIFLHIQNSVCCGGAPSCPHSVSLPPLGLKILPLGSLHPSKRGKETRLEGSQEISEWVKPKKCEQSCSNMTLTRPYHTATLSCKNNLGSGTQCPCMCLSHSQTLGIFPFNSSHPAAMHLKTKMQLYHATLYF